MKHSAVTTTLFTIEGSLILLTFLLMLAPPPDPGWKGIALRALGTTLCFVVAFYFNNLYDLRIVRSFKDFLSRFPQSLALALLLLLPLQALNPENGKIPGVRLFSTLAIVVALLLLLRAGSYKVMRSLRFTQRVLVLGANPLARQILGEIESRPHLRFSIVGVVCESTAGRESLGCPVIGSVDHLGKIVEEINPHRIIVAMTDRSRIPVRELLECRLRGITVEEGVEVYERLTGKLPIEWLTPSHLVFSKDFQKSTRGLGIARVMSLLASAAALVCLAPVLGFIALAIKLDSRGPVFVVQSRVGRGGKPFRLIKFRTMHPIEGDTPLWFSDGANNRVTRVGKWLRKFRLDEFPQFVNVLNGDMNIVGPRPHREPKFKLLALVWRNAPECGQPIPYHSLRCLVPPGITGWAQVRYRYARDLEEETEKVRYDLYYLRHRSLWLDLLIILDTIKITFLGRGSATMPAYRPEPRQDRPQEKLQRIA